MARGRMLSTTHAPVLIVGPSTDSNKEAGVEPQCKVGAGAQEGLLCMGTFQWIVHAASGFKHFHAAMLHKSIDTPQKQHWTLDEDVGGIL